MKDKYLPIGTVVMLKGGTKRVMITGYCSIEQDKPEKMYDYNGCLYPEGFLSSNQTCLFDHNQIDKIYSYGLEDEEEKKFIEQLKLAISQIGEKHDTTNTPASNPMQ